MEDFYDVIVVGAGVSGLGCGYYLEKANLKYKIFEANPGLGGTWYSQRFPGVRFDSLHFQTLYSFEPLDCPMMCDGKRFLAYLNNIAEKYKVLPHISFNESVIKANFDSKTNLWEVTTKHSTERKFRSFKARFLFNCNGYYSKFPFIPEEFKDYNTRVSKKVEILHSFEADQDKLELAGKDVVIIGSGATSTTMVPSVQEKARSLTFIQRSPNWLLEPPISQYPFYSLVVRLHEKGITWPWKIYRLFIICFIHLALNVLFTRLRKSTSRYLMTKLTSLYLPKELVENHFTPKHEVGEQRLCASQGFFTAIKKSNVANLDSTDKLKVSDKGLLIVDTRTNSVVKEIPCDMILLATGFNLDYFKFNIFFDNEKVDMYEKVFRHDFLFEGVPNFCTIAIFARLAVKRASCFTPGIERNIEFMVDMVKYMKKNNYERGMIKETKLKVERDVPMSSRYIVRNQQKCFKMVKKEADESGSLAMILGFKNKFNPENFTFC